ncbi:MAG TPA: OmpA family protein, partial [Pseudomonadota bacterium]|nr:OmpA family protein [Pseudomonadota bacterium]
MIEHQLIAHVDLAASFLDRILISASLPVTLFEAGYPQLGINPSNGLALGDPRLGAKVRLFGQPYRGPIALSLSADVWIPINSFSDRQPFPAQSGESGVRVLPKLIAGGLFSHILWSVTAGFYYRPSQAITGLAPQFGNSAGSELLIGAAIAYASLEHRFAIGPEAVYSATVLGENALQPQTMSLDLLLAAHYNIARILQVGVAGGYGVLQQSGSPDARALLRLAYAPMKPEKPKDRDHDGVPDKTDLCPDEHQGSRPDPEMLGCPLRDRDNDDIADKIDQCPDEPAGAKPDPNKLGCPLRDKDGDGALDPDDQCIDEPAGARPDPKKPGCPLRDRDGDGVVDIDDQCVEMPAGNNPDPLRPGCPDLDTDNDGVFDGKDQCKTVPAGNNPDPARPGCPIPDRDKDLVPDGVDACPDKPGAPSADPKKNGCPGLVEVKGSMIVILQQVFFATAKDVILPKSFPVLNAVADVLSQIPQIQRVAIEGHTDNKGKADYNRDLSARRAKSVMTYLMGRGIAEARLESHGYGPDKPVADNKTEKGRALNRRVDFVILKFQAQNGESLATPPPAAAAPATAAPTTAAPTTAAPTTAA